MVYYKPRSPEPEPEQKKSSPFVQFLRILFILIPLFEIICFVEAFSCDVASTSGAVQASICFFSGIFFGILALVTCTVSIALEKAAWIQIPLYFFWVLNAFVLLIMFLIFLFSL